MFKNVGLSIILSLFLLIMNVQAFQYDIIYFINESTGTSLTTTPVPFFAENAGTIELDLGLFSRHNASPSFTYNGNYLSPYSNTYAVTSETRTDNSSCADLGSAVRNYTSTQVIESRNTLTNDADFFAMSSQSKITFTTDDRFLRLFSGNLTDSEQFLVNKYQCIECLGDTVTVAVNISQFFNSDNVGICQNVIPTRANARFVGGEDLFIYTLFNSTTGNISFSSEFFGASTDVRLHIIYPFDDPLNPTTLTNNPTTSGNTVLDANRLYVYAVGGTPVAGNERVPDINLTIDLGLADYVCPAFGPCVDGFQTRECVDANGLQPNRIDNQACSLIILQNATLGFEEFFSTSDILKCVPSWLPFCPHTITNITLDRPLNWTVVDPAYGGANFLQMTQEYATEGTRSLKMWQIPPKEGEVLTNVTCGNLTGSVIPQVLQGVSNSTFAVSHNVTFPDTNMQITFDVKKCSSQVLQYTGLFPFCSERCYSSNCTTDPRGRYVFNVLDTTTGESIFGVPQYRDAVNQTLSPIYSISNLGIVAGRTYNIVFAISNENPNDATGNCIYIDNVRYQVTEQSLLDLGCESRCNETTRLEASFTPSGSCFLVIQEDSSLCTDQATREAIENQEDFCRDTATLRTFNEKTGKYESISCSSGFVCNPLPPEVGNPGSCITEEEAAEGATTPTEPINLVNELIQFLSTRMFWALVIVGIIFAAGIVTVSSLSNNPHWEGPALIALIPLVFFIAIEWLPLETGALIALPIALMIVNLFRKAT